MDDIVLNRILIVTTIVSTSLFIFSEILAASSCSYNAVYQFLRNGCVCVALNTEVATQVNHENSIPFTYRPRSVI